MVYSNMPHLLDPPDNKSSHFSHSCYTSSSIQQDLCQMHMPLSNRYKYIIQGQCSLIHYCKFCMLTKENTLKTSSAAGECYAKLLLIMVPQSSKLSLTYARNTTSIISGFLDITNALMAQQNNCTLTFTRPCSRQLMEINSNGAQQLTQFSGQNEWQYANTWDVYLITLLQGLTPYSLLISLKQHICNPHPMLCYPLLTSLPDKLSTSSNAKKTLADYTTKYLMLDNKLQSTLNMTTQQLSTTMTSTMATQFS